MLQLRGYKPHNSPLKGGTPAIEYSYKFRLYPTVEQEILIQKTFGCCRFVYNHFLNERIESYKSTGEAPSRFEQSNSLTGLKTEFEWLREVDSTALQTSLQYLDAAYQNFFRRVRQGKRKCGFLRFKRKHGRKSYTTKCVGTNIQVKDGTVRLPKLGVVKCRVSKEVTGRIIHATVSQTPSGRYFVSVCCTDVEVKKLPEAGYAVGVDVGLKSFAVTSDGTEYPNHKYMNKSRKRLARLQRRLSRKPKDSKRREVQRGKIARLHEHIANQRKDSLHKLSTQLIRNNDVICVEDLSTQNMLKNHNLAGSISDAAWGEFMRQLKYKAEWYGRQIIVVDRYYPSSQICSNCGVQNPTVKDLSVRRWKCRECGAEHDRDVNAAKNILREGIRIAQQ